MGLTACWPPPRTLPTAGWILRRRGRRAGPFFAPGCAAATRAAAPAARLRLSLDERGKNTGPTPVDVEGDAAQRLIEHAPLMRVHVSPPSVDFQIPLPGPPPFMQHAVRRRW